ncbi:MAG: CHAT domain-containing protein, partial [Cyanobacteriota bacterium]
MNTFEITVQRKVSDRCTVIVEYTLSDTLLPIRAEGEFSVDLEELRRQATPLEYGTILGEALFRDKVLRAFDRARAESQRNEEGLRILLFIEDQELRTLRWERLCISTDDSWSLDGAWDFLALNQQLPFSLYLPSTIDRRFPPIGKRDLRALVVVAGPDNLDSWGLAPFDVATTVSAVKTALGEIPHDVLAMVDGAVGAPTLDELSKKLVEKPYTLLHFVCHGQIVKQGELKGETQLYLSDANNQVDPVEGRRLLNALRNTRITRLPHFAFFCTCHSANPETEGAFGGLAQRLVRELGMPAVVAMTKEVSIKTAEALSGRFYERLREHGYVDSALVEATAGLDSRFDITVPALFNRLGGRPLFSDKLDRPLTDEEIKFGLSRLHDLLVRDKRAPILQEIFETQAANLLRTIDAQSDVAQKEQEEARKWINQICGEVLDLSFRSVALNEAVPPYDDRCPFRGLYPFHLEDREFFFGREALIEQLQQKLTEHNFLAVLGASGSGKSSVVLAGLIPALQKQEPDLQMAYLTPSSNPLAQLEVSLAKVQGQSFIIVVDQFEELFTLCTNEADRRTFISHLLTLLQSQKIVTTMRADFWGECAPYQELKELMEARQKLIAPMNAVELRRSMEKQASKVGLRFEAGLSNLVLDEVQDEPGAMPLLQHALLELWKRRHGRWLSRSEYEEIGGVKQAIAKTADNFYENLQTDIEREQIRNIFVRLTRLDKTTVQGEKRRDTRRRIDIEDFGGDPTVIKTLVLQLADAKVRLVVTSLDETTKRQQVEVAHEALIRHWTRLGKWLDENRIILQLLERLNQEAKDWSDAGKKDEFLLLQGGRLDEAAKLKNQAKFTLNQLEQNYIDACVALQEREKIESQRQRDEAIQGQITALAALSKSSFAADEQFEALVAAVKAAT